MRVGQRGFYEREAVAKLPLFGNRQDLPANVRPNRKRSAAVIEIEVQNETNQSQEKLRFSAVPRIGEGIRLLDNDGFWASYDVLDVWYQKAEYGEVWVPYLHVRKTDAGYDGAVAGQKEGVSYATL